MSPRLEALTICKETLLVATLTAVGMTAVFLWRPFPLSVLVFGDVCSSLLVGMSHLVALRLARISSRVVEVNEADVIVEEAVAKSS